MAINGRRGNFSFPHVPPFHPKPKSTNTHCIKKIRKKKKRRFAGYTFSSCRSSGNICGWFSRKLRNGVLIYGLFLGVTETQSL